MQSKATTPAAYLAELPPDRRAALQAVRKVILENLDRGRDGKSGFTEGMAYGMIGYAVPHSIYPPGYHCDPRQPLPFMGLASQKNHLAVYLMCTFHTPAMRQQFEAAWAKAGKKLNMGGSCIRFKKVDDLALDVLGDTIRRVTVPKFIAHYEAAILPRNKAASAKAKSASAKAAGAKPRRTPARTTSKRS